MSAPGLLGRLAVDEDDLAACVSCGLCLPYCPTYRVTGEESASPRGRIAAMRAVQEGAPMDEAFTRFMDLCVQCRACEVACPSAVPFGRLMEGARAALASQTGYQPWWRRAGYAVLGHHRLLVGLTSLGAVAQRAGLVPRRLTQRLALPRLPVRQPPLRPSGTDVWIFPGCVMDAWQRPVHAATQSVIEATGAGVALPGRGADCCGALHIHAGLTDAARRLARRVMAALPGDAPILVDSAGCGAALKDYGHLLGTPEAETFAARVRDVHEWLAERVDRLPPAGGGPSGRGGWAGWAGRAGRGGRAGRVGWPGRAGRGGRDAGGRGDGGPGGRAGWGPVAVQDPCHLRQVQKCHLAVRTVLGRYADLVELDDEGLCCGAGGAYSVINPELAGPIRSRKLAAVARSGAGIVVSANPGCSMWLAAAGLDVRHPMELVASAIVGDARGG